MNNLKKISTILLVIVFVSPVLGAYFSTIGLSSESQQYSGIQGIVMGVYNLPFVIASLVTLLVGDNFYKKQKVSASTKLLSTSIISSIVGTTLMLLWGLGIF